VSSFPEPPLDFAFSASDINDVYWRLASVVGTWTAEQERLNSISQARALIAIGRKLSANAKDPDPTVITALSGHETGLRQASDIELVSQLSEALARKPEIGSIAEANRRITAFLKNPTQTDATILAAACLDAAQNLKEQVGGSGRPKLDWYDDFTKLLLEIAQKAGIEPTFWKDRITGERHGWLFEAAQQLESFFHAGMHSPGGEACGKRLETSRRRLSKRRPESV
jgi:hypothetical protein